MMLSHPIVKVLTVLAAFCSTTTYAYPAAPPLFDVIVIGGGPAGLSATSGLARVRRNVLMLDSGEYRNAATRHMHDVIGNDGTVPAAFRALAREQIMRYPTAHMMNATVTAITGNLTSTFGVQSSDGASFYARRIILATGMKDVMPSTPGVAENWGKGIFWCPWCDGYEHRDQPFGILGSYADVLSTVFEVHNLESDIIAFVNGTNTPSVVANVNANPPQGYNSWEAKLAAYNIVIDNRTLTSITRLQDGASNYSASAMAEYDRFLITFADGSTTTRNALIANFPSTQRSGLGASLGISLDAKQHLKTDGGMESEVKGVYVVGDANADNSTNVPHAMWSGKRSAVGVHIALEEERADTLVQKRSAGRAALQEEVELMMEERDLRDIYDRLPWS